jgi:hypothetical protein
MKFEVITYFIHSFQFSPLSFNTTLSYKKNIKQFGANLGSKCSIVKKKKEVKIMYDSSKLGLNY